jgi:hypothetical protein
MPRANPGVFPKFIELRLRFGPYAILFGRVGDPVIVEDPFALEAAGCRKKPDSQLLFGRRSADARRHVQSKQPFETP